MPTTLKKNLKSTVYITVKSVSSNLLAFNNSIYYVFAKECYVYKPGQKRVAVRDLYQQESKLDDDRYSLHDLYLHVQIYFTNMIEDRINPINCTYRLNENMNV